MLARSTVFHEDNGIIIDGIATDEAGLARRTADLCNCPGLVCDSGSNLTIDGTVYTKDASFTADTSVGSTLTDAVLMNDPWKSSYYSDTKLPPSQQNQMQPWSSW